MRRIVRLLLVLVAVVLAAAGWLTYHFTATRLITIDPRFHVLVGGCAMAPRDGGALAALLPLVLLRKRGR